MVRSEGSSYCKETQRYFRLDRNVFVGYVVVMSTAATRSTAGRARHEGFIVKGPYPTASP